MAADDPNNANPYKILGVARDATQDQIRAAYRKLAKRHHPDLTPGNKAAEEKFKAISSANELLSDPEKRARFDRGEIDASGQERPEAQFYRQYAEGRQGRKYAGPGAGPGAGGGFGAGMGAGPGMNEDLGDIFADLFAAGHGREGATIRMRGADQHYLLPVDFLDMVNGATRRLGLPDGRNLDVKVPPGIEDGQVLRLRGQGGPGLNGGPDGDALIEIQVTRHPLFHREGHDITVELPVTLTEAVLGGRIEVPTPSGTVAMNVPKHSDTGTRLRLRGKGIAAHGNRAAGDLYVTLKVVVGPPDAALEGFLREWKPAEPFNPRSSMKGES